MLCWLQVDDDQFAAIALGQQRDVATGHDLQGGAQTHTQVSLSGTQMEQMEKVLPIGMICSTVPIHTQVSLSGTQMEQLEKVLPIGMICSMVPRHTLRSACLEHKWNKWRMFCRLVRSAVWCPDTHSGQLVWNTIE